MLDILYLVSYIWFFVWLLSCIFEQVLYIIYSYITIRLCPKQYIMSSDSIIFNRMLCLNVNLCYSA